MREYPGKILKICCNYPVVYGYFEIDLGLDITIKKVLEFLDVDLSPLICDNDLKKEEKVQKYFETYLENIDYEIHMTTYKDSEFGDYGVRCWYYDRLGIEHNINKDIQDAIDKKV